MKNLRETSSQQFNSKKRKFESSSFYRENNEPNTENEFYYIYESKKKQLCSNFKISESILNSDKLTNSPSKFSLKPIGKQIKLFDMCLSFISLNLEAVDSLVGFPSQIGELLFFESIKVGKFDCKSTSHSSVKKNLDLFLTAYPSDLITSLRLKNKSELKCVFPLIKASSNITHLDLSYSSLNSYLTELDLNLAEILKSSSKTLSSLNLSGNNLDAIFIKKFTLPQRLNVVNFESLKSINLSFNQSLHLSNEFITNIQKFDSLKEIILNKTQLIDENKKYFNGFIICSCDTKLANKLHFQNSGWIAKLNIEDLIFNETKNFLSSSADYKTLLNNIRDPSTYSFFKSEISFYKKKTDHNKETTNESQYCELDESFIILRNDCICSKSLKSDDSRKNDSLKNKIEKSTNIIKKNKSTFKIDDDILRMYM